jgi:hypothetical protein
MHAALPGYVWEHVVLRCRAGGRPDDLRYDPVMMAYLVPEQWRFEGRRRQMAMAFSDRLRGRC